MPHENSITSISGTVINTETYIVLHFHSAALIVRTVNNTTLSRVTLNQCNIK